MSLEINNLNNIQSNPNPQMNTTFKANPVETTNTLERIPTNDTLIKPTQNKTKKTLLTLGGLVLAGVGIFAAVKAGKAHQQKKAIQEIEKKFADLQNDMPRVQKTFKEVFLREDLTEKEALEMLNRYKDVEKIRITGSKEEYARAIFNEAKNNYGFKNAKLKYYFSPLKQFDSGGEYLPIYLDKGARIIISSNESPERLVNIVHHELRHMKQCQLGVNYNSRLYEKNLYKQLKTILDKESLDKYCTVKNILNQFGQTKPNINIVPREHQELAKKISEYVRDPKYKEHGKEYFEDFLEVDARSAGESIAKLFGLMAR